MSSGRRQAPCEHRAPVRLQKSGWSVALAGEKGCSLIYDRLRPFERFAQGIAVLAPPVE